MQPRIDNNRRQGFMLIEFLVVISFIALLIGILLPALGVAQAAARSIACSAQLKQIRLAVLPQETDRGYASIASVVSRRMHLLHPGGAGNTLLANDHAAALTESKLKFSYSTSFLKVPTARPAATSGPASSAMTWSSATTRDSFQLAGRVAGLPC